MSKRIELRSRMRTIGDRGATTKLDRVPNDPQPGPAEPPTVAELGSLTADPRIPINCSTCGRPLIFLRTETEAYFYLCPRDGSFVLPRNGRERRHRSPHPPPTVAPTS